MTLTPTEARDRIEAMALKQSGLERPGHDPTTYAKALRAVLREPDGARLYALSVGRESAPAPVSALSEATARADAKAREAQRPGEAYADALSRVLNKQPELYQEACSEVVRGPAQAL